MQKTGAGVVCHGDACLPASDLERSKDRAMTDQTGEARLWKLLPQAAE